MIWCAVGLVLGFAAGWVLRPKYDHVMFRRKWGLVAVPRYCSRRPIRSRPMKVKLLAQKSLIRGRRDARLYRLLDGFDSSFKQDEFYG
jgi:hypothetical protein